MSYNIENLKTVSEEYKNKSLLAESTAQTKKEKLYETLPELREIDQKLAEIGMSGMLLALRNGTPEQMEECGKKSLTLQEKRKALLIKNGYPADYTDPKYECSLCHDTGFVGIKRCICMQRKLMEADMKSSGMYVLLKKQNFENFSLDYYQGKEKTLMQFSFNKLKQYADNFTLTSSNLLLMGGTGLGKTHLSSAVANVVLQKGYNVFYNTVSGLVGDFQAGQFGNMTMPGNPDNVRKYMSAELLILDDLGTEMVNQYTTNCLYQVLNTRMNQEMPTIINTNLSSTTQIQALYNSQLTSRIASYEIIPFAGQDIRLQK